MKLTAILIVAFSAEEFCLWLWRRLIHVKSYLRGQPFSYYGSGICIYRWYWCNRCLPAVERGARRTSGQCYCIPRNQPQHLRAIKALDIRRRGKLPSLMQSGLWTWLRFVIMLKVKDILILLFSHVIEPYITMLKDSYTTQVLISSVRLADQNSNMLYQFIRKQYSSGKKTFFDIEVDVLKDELELFRIDNGEKVYLYQNFKDFNKVFLQKILKNKSIYRD